MQDSVYRVLRSKILFMWCLHHFIVYFTYEDIDEITFLFSVLMNII